MELHHMSVDGKYRDQGIGRALINTSMTYAKCRNCCYLAVAKHPENNVAKGMFLAGGFESVPLQPLV
jgi:GNAT superfamily N-acetyltransferase